MNLNKLSGFFEQKYELTSQAADPKMADVEANIRNSLDILWEIPNRLFNILRACADASASKPKNINETQAVEGHRFCKRIVSIIDYLKANKKDIPLSDIRKALTLLVKEIKENQKQADEKLQFPHVSELIFQMLSSSSKYDRKLRDQQYAKARKGLSRITSIALTILNAMNKLGGATEEFGRFEPQGAKLSNSEIMSFIRRHGDDYNIPDLETWSHIINTDPSLELPLTRLVHALSRGKIPSGNNEIRSIIQNILDRRQEATQTNAPLFEEEGEAWDKKMAFKYDGSFRRV